MFYLFFDIAEVGCKIDAIQHITNCKNIEVLKIPAKEFAQNQQSDEIWYHDAVYDVSNVTIVNDTAFVSVFHDTTEETLVKITWDSFEPNTRLAMGCTNHITKHLVVPVDDSKIIVEVDNFFTYQFGVSITRFFYYATPACLFVSRSVIKPPPQYILA